MAAEGQTLHRGSKSLGFCDCEVIDRVGVRPLAQPEGEDPSETPGLKYKLISKRNKNTKRTNDRAHARFSPHNDNGVQPREDLRKLNNSVQDLRPRTRYDARQKAK